MKQEDSMTDKLSKIVALSGAACVFAGGMLSLPTNVLGDLAISLPLSGLTGFGLWYFMPGRKTITKADVERIFEDQEKLAKASGVSNKELVDTVTLVSDKLDRILLEATAIKSPNTIRRIKHLDAVGRKIIEDFRQDPADIKRAQTWIHSYLDQTIDCVKQYARLSRTGQRSLSAQEQMAEFDVLLDELLKRYQELLDKLLANDTLALEVNVSVLRDQLNNEGI
jgi:5-bromo-4-chloroindolyl phosphate hydrolysis protein